MNSNKSYLYTEYPRLNILCATALIWGTFFFPIFGQQETRSLNNSSIDGYKGIWFTLGQFYEYGDKYSGGLGTYTAKHIPMAVHAPEVNRTYFVYGGTTAEDAKHLLCMIGSYDHKKGVLSKPTVVHDKKNVSDPHDNPSLLIDAEGYIWVFVSGRSTKRPGFKYKSVRPYDIEHFELVSTEEMTYPQPWLMPDGSFFHFFTKYTGRRELYFETSNDGMIWDHDRKLAGMKREQDKLAGHYQISASREQTVGTFFSWHPNGNVDKRTNLYYIKSSDKGHTWNSANGSQVKVPFEHPENTVLIVDYHNNNRNVYLKDMGFTSTGEPVCLYLTSGGHEPGPQNQPYQWMITKYSENHWEHYKVCTSDHNYDMGSLFISGDTWFVVAPVIEGPQKYAPGGEIAIYKSVDKGLTWNFHLQVTHNSLYNHNYVRRPINARSPFMFFWTDGDPTEMSMSKVYFGNMNGDVWMLPYKMYDETERPQKINYTKGKIR